MSDYNRKKVLRVPADKYGIKDVYELLQQHPDERCSWEKEIGFNISLTEREFLDYVLEDEYPAASVDYGNARCLTENEKAKYLPIFQKLIPTINMDDVHLVEFCWYNCTEAPDYYNVDEGFAAEV